MASTPGLEPGPHWWQASTLTSAPPVLSIVTSIVVLGQITQTVFWLSFYDVLGHSNKMILSVDEETLPN